jgi:hypothetical protein
MTDQRRCEEIGIKDIAATDPRHASAANAIAGAGSYRVSMPMTAGPRRVKRICGFHEQHPEVDMTFLHDDEHGRLRPRLSQSL